MRKDVLIIILAVFFLLVLNADAMNGEPSGNLLKKIVKKYNVQGSFNSADCNQIKGYTCYQATPNLGLTVYLQEGTSVKATSTANQKYPVTSLCSPNHGFTITTPATLKDGLKHSLSVYALDPVKKTKVLISGSPKSITCAAPTSQTIGTTTTLPASCTNNVKDQDETDADCGGSICTTRCSVTQTCITNSDCIYSTCVSGVCTASSSLETTSNNNCADGIDNDADNLIDCQDSGCSTSSTCQFLAYCGKPCTVTNTTSPTNGSSSTTLTCPSGFTCSLTSKNCYSSLCVESSASGNCADNLDNDEDSFIDCQENSCGPSSQCPTVSGQENQTNFNCADGKDNDYDGKTDCMDSGCFGAPMCFAESSTVPVGFASSIAICYDGGDNDLDGLIDGKDPDCFELYNEGKFVSCFDGLDNDLDGAKDNSDPDCSFFVIESNGKGCIDGVDNDGNGQQDCNDPACTTHNLCGEAGNSCWDGIDNNKDGGVDCSPWTPDKGCASAGACTPQETGKCSDDIDNDQDQLRDCNDPDCSQDSLCSCVDSDGQNYFAPGDVTFINPLASPKDRYDRCPPQGTGVVPNYLMELTCNGATRYNTPGWQIIDCRTLSGTTKGVCLNNRCV